MEKILPGQFPSPFCCSLQGSKPFFCFEVELHLEIDTFGSHHKILYCVQQVEKEQGMVIGFYYPLNQTVNRQSRSRKTWVDFRNLNTQ